MDRFSFDQTSFAIQPLYPGAKRDTLTSRDFKRLTALTDSKQRGPRQYTITSLFLGNLWVVSSE